MIDIDAAFLELDKKQKAETPWDASALHVSDLSLCARQVWARRNNLTEIVVDLDNLVQMMLGLKYEQILCAALDAAGAGYQYQVPIPGTLLGHEITGTADFVFEDAVLDAKSTVFWSGYVGTGDQKRKEVKIPDYPKMGYRIQAASYAIALGKPSYGIKTVCRASGKRRTFWYETSYLAEDVGKALVERIDTKMGDPEPIDARPPEYTYGKDGRSWQCEYCTYSACQLNRNKSLQVI